MKLAYDLAIDGFPEPEPSPDAALATQAIASWYAPGLSDEIGDRLLMFDNSSAPSLELLRFRRALTGTPGFEVALRRRVEQLSDFRHPSFATVRAVESLGHGHGPALLSNYTPGRRLSEVIQNVRGPAFATALIEQLTPALASLRQHGQGGHGALTASRIVVTPEGRLVIVEHVLGSALLQLPASRLSTEFGIAVPQSRAADLRLDIQTDYFQLGLIALSLLVGRQVSASESPETVARLLQEVARTADRESPWLFRRLRLWLERALQLNGEAFESSAEAEDAFNNLSEAGVLRSLPRQSLHAIPAQTDPATDSPRPVDSRTPSEYDGRAAAPAVVPERPAPREIVPPSPPADAIEETEAVFQPAPEASAIGARTFVPDAATFHSELEVEVREQLEPETIPSMARGASESPASIQVEAVSAFVSEKPVSKQPVPEFAPEEPVSRQPVPQFAWEEPISKQPVPKFASEDPVSQQPIPGPLSMEPVTNQALGQFVSEESGSGQDEQHAIPGKSLFIEVDPPRLRSTVASIHNTPVPRAREKPAAPPVGGRSSPARALLALTLSALVSASKRKRSIGRPGLRPRRSETQDNSRRAALPSLAAVLGLAVVAQGFVIGRLLHTPAALGAPLALLVETVDPGADVVVDGQSAGFTPLQLNLAADTRSIRVVDSRSPAENATVPRTANRPATPAGREGRTAGAVAPTPQRTGGIRLVVPFDVEVFEGSRRLGSTATGIISAPAGRHELELVNGRLGYRARQVVNVTAGQVASVSVSPPNGRLSINALPWAEVFIGGKSMGETPLANLSVPLGEHEIIFRHPQLGERRQTAVVRQGSVTRVSANLQR